MAKGIVSTAREKYIDSHQCARGHPKCTMVEAGHKDTSEEAYLDYQCPTCDRKIRYHLSRTGVEGRSIMNRGRMDPE